jgi:hypothetical protein
MRVERVEQPVIFDSDCLSAFAAFSDGIKIIKETLGDMVKQSCDRRDLREHRQRLPKCDIRREKQYARGVQDKDRRSSHGAVPKAHRSKRKPVMGDGEAAAIALVSVMGGTVASNNLGDIKEYCVQNRIQFICSDDILCLAVQRQVINSRLASLMWDTMKKFTGP